MARPRAVSVAAATAWPARLRSWPRSSAQSSPRRLRAGRPGGDSGHRGPRGPPTPGRGAGALPLALFLRCGNSWPGSYGRPAGKADAYCFAGPTVGERALGRVAGEPPMRPSPAWRSPVPRAGQAGEPDLEGCENARGGVPGTGVRLGLGIAGLSGENPERQLGAVTSTKC